MDNAFLELAHKIKEKNINQNIYIGIVKTTGPLIITINGIELNREDLLVNANLIYNNSINLNIADKVLIISSEDKQNLVLLCKVV